MIYISRNNLNLKSSIVKFLIVLVSCYFFGFTPDNKVPHYFKDFISSMEVDKLGGQKPEIEFEKLSENLTRIKLTWNLKKQITQDDWKVKISPSFTPSFHWAPHLTPKDDNIIAQHVFRTPALILSSSERQLVIIPDINILRKSNEEWYMDLNAIDNELTLGLSKSSVEDHVLFKKAAGASYPSGKMEFGFYIMVDKDPKTIFNPWRKILSFFWNTWGEKAYNTSAHNKNNLDPYVFHTYNWAFNLWKPAVWQEFTLNTNNVGAPVFIVNVTQSPNYPLEVNEREFRSIWNQAWFSSLRSASGLYRYARRSKNPDLLVYANKTKELALSFPQNRGFFPAVIATEMEKVEKDGKEINRSLGWNTFYFGNSNRNPYSRDAKESPYHILDMSFTAYQMLIWFQELEKDERLLDYATAYADALLKIQDRDGFFPGWLSLDSLHPLPVLNKSSETSMTVTFLLKQHELTQKESYKKAALLAMEAVIENIVPQGKWEDFETYWSCSAYGINHLVNKKEIRNNMYKQNNFSMFWTAEALFNCYKATGNNKYLKLGQRTLDEMLMTQDSWQPPYMYVDVLGGFGVLNADGEWNDARQSLFAELIIKYGKELNQKEYIQRGLAALRASFVMMYCPENPKTKKQWETKWPFFGKEDYGFMMENYGHDGATSAEGLGIGEFTIYDWGNGAAAEAYNRIVDHYGYEFIQNN